MQIGNRIDKVEQYDYDWRIGVSVLASRSHQKLCEREAIFYSYPKRAVCSDL